MKNVQEIDKLEKEIFDLEIKLRELYGIGN